MKTVAEVIGVSRSNLADRLRERPKKRIGRPPLPDDGLVSKIKAVIAELPTYGYRRVHAVLKRQALAAGLKPPNHKRVYRVSREKDGNCVGLRRVGWPQGRPAWHVAAGWGRQRPIHDQWS